MDLHIEDVLIRKVVTINSEFTIKQATDMMSENYTSCLVVLTGNIIDGILTTRDVIFRVVAKGMDPEKVYVKEVMTKPVIIMRPETPLTEAIKIMLQKRIKKLPLIEGERSNARLVGLLSLSDLVEYHPEIFSELWEETLITEGTVEERGEVVIV